MAALCVTPLLGRSHVLPFCKNNQKFIINSLACHETLLFRSLHSALDYNLASLGLCGRQVRFLLRQFRLQIPERADINTRSFCLRTHCPRIKEKKTSSSAVRQPKYYVIIFTKCSIPTRVAQFLNTFINEVCNVVSRYHYMFILKPTILPPDV